MVTFKVPVAWRQNIRIAGVAVSYVTNYITDMLNKNSTLLQCKSLLLLHPSLGKSKGYLHPTTDLSPISLHVSFNSLFWWLWSYSPPEGHTHTLNAWPRLRITNSWAIGSLCASSTALPMFHHWLICTKTCSKSTGEMVVSEQLQTCASFSKVCVTWH